MIFKVPANLSYSAILPCRVTMCPPHSRLCWSQWQVAEAGVPSVGAWAAVTTQSCSNLPLRIKISFYGTFYTWPLEESMTINGVCILKPNLEKEQEIIRLAGEDGAGRARAARLFMSVQRHKEVKCINGAARPSSEWGFK